MMNMHQSALLGIYNYIYLFFYIFKYESKERSIYLFFFIIIGYFQYNSFKSKDKSLPLYMFYHSYNSLPNLRRNNYFLRG